MSLDNFITQFGGMTEEYKFYKDEITLTYDVKAHQYLLVTADGLELQDGCTSVCHIIDKSEALIPWAVKMMAAKLFLTTPTMTLPTGDRIVQQMSYADYEALVLAAKSAHKEKLEDAGQVGHVAHAWIENYIKSILANDEPRKLELLSKFPLDERSRNACFAALDWMKRHNVRWLGTERKIYSRRYKYAGTMDGLCIVDSCDRPLCCPSPFKDRLTIADWKTSNYLYMEYLLQTAAYMQAFNEQRSYEEPESPLAVDRWVIRLGKEDGEFETWHADVETFAEDWNGFLTALTLKRSVASIQARIKAKADNLRAVAKAEKKAAKEAATLAAIVTKAKIKAEKQAAKDEALRLKCKNADKYQGKRKPTCNGGAGCKACLEKYSETHSTKGDNETFPSPSLPAASPDSDPANPCGSGMRKQDDIPCVSGASSVIASHSLGDERTVDIQH